jgi:hypothetical protein
MLTGKCVCVCVCVCNQTAGCMSHEGMYKLLSSFHWSPLTDDLNGSRMLQELLVVISYIYLQGLMDL